MDHECYVSSLDAVAAFLRRLAKPLGRSCGRRWVMELRKREGFPRKTEHGYPLGETAEWMLRNVWAPEPEQQDQRKATHAELQTELLELEVEDKRIDVAAKKDRLVDRDVQMRENIKLFAYIRGRMEQQPTEHAMIFPEAVRSEAVREWKEANRLLCRELSAYRPEDESGE